MATQTAPKESPRIRGKKLGFKLGNKEYWPDMTKAELSATDSDDTATFGSIQAGGTPMKLVIEAIQSTAKTSLWRYLFEHVGESVEFMLAIHGNEKPTADEPHITGTCVIEMPPKLSTEVKNTSTFDLELPVETWQMTDTASTAS